MSLSAGNWATGNTLREHGDSPKTCAITRLVEDVIGYLLDHFSILYSSIFSSPCSFPRPSLFGNELGVEGVWTNVSLLLSLTVKPVQLTFEPTGHWLEAFKP